MLSYFSKECGFISNDYGIVVISMIRTWPQGRPENVDVDVTPLIQVGASHNSSLDELAISSYVRD